MNNDKLHRDSIFSTKELSEQCTKYVMNVNISELGNLVT